MIELKPSVAAGPQPAKVGREQGWRDRPIPGGTGQDADDDETN